MKLTCVTVHNSGKIGDQWPLSAPVHAGRFRAVAARFAPVTHLGRPWASSTILSDGFFICLFGENTRTLVLQLLRNVTL